MTKTFQFLPENRYDWATLSDHVIACAKQHVYEGVEFNLHLPVVFYGNLFQGFNMSYFENGCIWLDLLEKNLPDMVEVPLEDVPEDLFIESRDRFMDDIAYFSCTTADGQMFFVACDVDDWSDVFLPIGTDLEEVA